MNQRFTRNKQHATARLGLAAALVMALSAATGWGQSNPTAHDLALSSFTFTGFANSATTTYPTSMQGWTFGSTEASSATTGPASADRVLVANTDTITTASIRNEGTSGISLLSSGTVGLGAICVSVNSTGRTNLQVTWTAADMVSTSTRVMGVKLQYRVGTSGSFTDVASSTYTSSASSAAAAQTFSNIALPEAAENQSVVQIRWLYYFASGSGARDRIRIDDITVASSAAAATPSITLADNGSQVGASSVAAGTANVILHQSSLAVTTANATLTGVSFTTAGTYSASDVSNFKVWYSADNSFSSSTDTLLGTISSSLGAGAKSVSSLSQAINSGSTGYLFITSDIAASPTGGVTLNVSALTTSDVTFSSGTKSGSTTAGGAKTLQAAALPNGPALSAAGSATVDEAFNVTFAENATWRGAITGVTVDGTALTGGWSASTSGQITFTPSASNPANLLRTPGSKTIVVSAAGYNPTQVIQLIGVGAPAKLAITTQPTAPADNGAALAVQPVVAIQDQYGNATTSTASVTAAAAQGTWTLGGTVTRAAVSGTATFSGLTATSSGAVTGATITFTSGSLTAATSNPGFNIPAPNHISLATAGTPVTENFNSLASTGTSNSSLPLGWYILETGSSANTTYAAGTGSDTGGNTYSFGASGSSDRALGGLQSGTVNPSWGVKVVNNTGATITTLAISYIGETWRVGAVNRSDRIDFQYSTDATSLSTGTWIDANSLDYANPGQAVTGSGSIQHSATISGAITGLNIANGAFFFIRWTDLDASGSDDGMAIEDFSIAVPVAPTIATGTAGSITATGATITGNNASADGGGAISERGVVWATTANPTVGAGTKVTDASTGTGTFNSTLTGLASGTTHYARAYAINVAGTSYGNDVTVLTVPGTPATPTSSSVGTTGFTVNWSATTGATSYRLDLSTASNFGTLVSDYSDLTVNSTSQAVSGLTPGTTYYARVRAVNASGTGANSATLTQATTGVPEIAVESPVGTGVASGGSRADFGTLTVANTADFTFRVLNSGSAALSVTGITFGGTHASDFTVVGGSTATIAAGGSQDFTIRFTPGADGARTGTVTFGNSDSDEGSYVISLSGTGSAAPVAPTVTSSAASLITATGATLNGTVNADGGAGITGRGFVYSSTDSTPTIEEGAGQVTTTGTTGAASEAVTGLANSTLYYFRVYASNSAGTSYGSVLSFTTLKGQPPLHVTGFAAGTITTANIPATWTGATADGYLLRVSSTTVNDPTDGTTVGDDTDLSDGAGTINLASNVTSYSSFTGFAAGTTYIFKLYPYNNSGANIDYLATGVPSFEAELLPAAPASAPTFASVTATGFTVNWSAVTGADSYRLDVSTASDFASFVGGYENLEVTGGTSQAVTGLSANTQYFARVRAVNTSGTGANSATGNQTTSQLSAPATLAASSITSSGFTANWNSVSGATGYRVDVYSTIVGTDLIISEYVEGSSNNKYIEIFNASSSSVTLSDYEVRLFINGATTASSTQNLGSLTGGPSTLAAGAVLVLRNGQANLSLPAGVTAFVSSGVTGYNGDDALAIWKTSANAYVDIFGVIGTDPGTGWTGGSNSTLDKTLRRKSTVGAGVTSNPASFSTLGTQWDQFDVDTASGLGSHSLTTFLTGFQNADAGNTTSLNVTGAAAAQQYSYVVRATSATSTSPNSDVRTVTTKGTSSITVNSGTTSLTFSGAAQGPTFTVTGSAGALSYSYAGTGATTYGPTATAPTNVGTYTVTATAAADASFDGAVSAATAFTIAKATPSITAAPTASAITYGQTLADSVLSGGTASVAGGFAFTSSSTAPNAGTASQGVTFTPTDTTNYNTATTTVSVTVNPASLASNQITLTPGAGNAYTASGPAGSTFTISYAGRSANGITTTYSSATAPTSAGYYTVTAAATGNYTGSNTADYFVAGPVAGNDSATKPADNSRIKIPTATLLANDSRIHTDGTSPTDNLSITAVANGTGAASISGAFVLFTPSAAGTDSFTYTVTDAVTGKTAIGTVTVTTEVAPPSFTLQIVGQGTASFDGTQTAVTMDFIGVPNQNYTVEYKGELSEASWTSAGAQPTGSTGSFSVTFTKAGNHTADWNGSMFFRASVAP